MSKCKTWLVAAVGCSLIAGQVSAQTIDQQQPAGAALAIGRTGADVVGQSNGWSTQSFVPSMTTAAGAAFYLFPTATGETGTLAVQLWTASPGAAGATQLASGTTALSGAAQFFSAFWTPVAVTPGATYFLAFYSAQPYILGANYNSAYPNGYYDYNKSNTATDAYDKSNRCCETVFQEYATGMAGPPTTTTPEPAMLALLGTGLLSLGGVAARRRRATTT